MKTDTEFDPFAPLSATYTPDRCRYALGSNEKHSGRTQNGELVHLLKRVQAIRKQEMKKPVDDI